MFKLHAKRVLLFAMIGIVISGLVIIFSPKVFEANTELLLGDQMERTQVNFTQDVMDILQRGVVNNAFTERQILRSQGVFYEALQRVGQKHDQPLIMEDFEDYYLMYDVIGERQASGGQQGGSVAQIQVKAYSRDLAIDIANEIVYVYNDMRRKTVQESMNDAILYLKSQIQIAKSQVEALDQNYRRLKEETNIPDLSLKATAISKNTADLTSALQMAEIQLKAVNSEIDAQKLKVEGMPETITDQLYHVKKPVIQQIENQIADYKRRRAELLTKYLEDAEPVRTIDSTISRLESYLKERQKQIWETSQRIMRIDPLKKAIEQNLISNEVLKKSLVSRISEIKSQIIAQEVDIDKLPKAEVRLEQMQRERSIADGHYRRLKSQLDELETRTGTSARSAFVLSPARTKEDPVSPDPLKLTFVGLIAGICLGLIYTASLDSLRLRVYNSSQLNQMTGLPVVVALPAISLSRLTQLFKKCAKPRALPLEGFRHMASYVLAKNLRENSIVLFTGAKLAHKSAFSATQLALAMALNGKKVLLIDYDFRKHILTTAFDFSGRQGFSDLLSVPTLAGQGASLAIPGPHTNMFIMPAGTRMKNMDLYTPQAIMNTLDKIRLDYDITILSTPPCDVYSDTSALTKSSDLITLVVSSTQNQCKDILTASTILLDSGAKDTCLVLTDTLGNDEPFSNLDLEFVSKQKSQEKFSEKKIESNQLKK